VASRAPALRKDRLVVFPPEFALEFVEGDFACDSDRAGGGMRSEVDAATVYVRVGLNFVGVEPKAQFVVIGFWELV